VPIAAVPDTVQSPAKESEREKFTQVRTRAGWSARLFGQTLSQKVIMIEVVVERLDREWWVAYRERLEARFAQKEIHLRAMPIERL
jgi:hypothetical protein